MLAWSERDSQKVSEFYAITVTARSSSRAGAPIGVWGDPDLNRSLGVPSAGAYQTSLSPRDYGGGLGRIRTDVPRSGAECPEPD